MHLRIGHGSNEVSHPEGLPMTIATLDPDLQLDLVRSWFDRDLTEAETIVAREMIERGDRPPYVARYLMMRAQADRKDEAQP